MKTLTTFLVLIFISSSILFCQVPQEITYQGLLTDANSNPLNGDYDLTFKLYSVSTEGASIWEENQKITVSDGIFNVILGSVNPLDIPFDKAFWLGISIGNEKELDPRIKLTSSPYSLMSQTVADNAITGSKIADDAIVAGQNVSVSRKNNGALEIASSGQGGLNLPFSGSTNTSGPAFNIENTGSGWGFGIMRADWGINVERVTFDGLTMHAVGQDGISIDSVGQVGLTILYAGIHGVDIHAANNFGVAIGSAQTGIWIDQTSSNGLQINQALANGVQVGKAETNGIQIGETTYDGIQIQNAGRDGIRVAGAGSLAGNFQGNVSISGTLTKGGGAFKIDNPLDPANKYLQHSFVESPDMMNVYNGNITLNVAGEAIVELPNYFETLNRDFRYQLTAIGKPAPNLYVAEKINGNRFKIAGGKPGMEVSWQVTGIRQDPWANAHRIKVEEEKKPEERGYYLHPKLYGQPESRNIIRINESEDNSLMK